MTTLADLVAQMFHSGAEAVKHSERVSRMENKKSEVVLSDMIRGTMPRYPDVQALRDYVRGRVNG